VNALSSYAKRVFDVNDRGWCLVAREGDSHDIEAKFRRGGLNTFQVQASCTHDAGALARIHRLKRMSAFLAGARTDLNEDKNTSIVRYQVQLPFGAAPVSLDNAIAARF
jgi:hypothetical protein